MDGRSDDTRRHKHGRRTWIRLDRYAVDEEWDEEAGGFPVTIHGVNLHGAVSPPTITVGGRRLRNTEFGVDGRTIRGVIDARPEDGGVVVDYGFARAEIDG